MFCKNCGQNVDENDRFCPHCGAKLKIDIPDFDEDIDINRDIDSHEIGSPNKNTLKKRKSNEDSGSVGWAVLGFILPIVGIILGLYWLKSKPKCAKKAFMGVVVLIFFVVIVEMFDIIGNFLVIYL